MRKNLGFTLGRHLVSGKILDFLRILFACYRFDDDGADAATRCDGDDRDDRQSDGNLDDGGDGDAEAEGNAGGESWPRHGVIPRRHKSISIDMSGFVFHRGYSLFWFHA